MPTRQRRSRVALAKPGPLPPPSIVFGACEVGATGIRLRLTRSLGLRDWRDAAGLFREPANRKCEDVAPACASPMKFTLTLDDRFQNQRSSVVGVCRRRATVVHVVARGAELCG